MEMRPPPSAGSLLACFEHWERVQPRRVYLVQPLADGHIVQYSWAQVGREARLMARYLQSRSCVPGTRIAILGKNSAHWLMADLAIWMAGCVSVPLYPTIDGKTARHILDEADVKLMFVGKLDGKTDNWAQIKGELPDALDLVALPMAPLTDVPKWNQIVAQDAPLSLPGLPAGHELASICYTSGSTGRPKGVMYSHGTMMAAVRAFEGILLGNRDDRLVSYLPLAAAGERAEVEAASLYHGSQVFFTHDLTTFPADIRRARPTIFLSMPRLWTIYRQSIDRKIPPRVQAWAFRIPGVSNWLKRQILRSLGLDQVRFAITGSAPLPAVTMQWYRDLGLELLECYGMTENFCVSHLNRPGSVRIGTVGTCMPGVEARISEIGEVEVKSPATMMGYYKQPELTAADMTPDGFFRTGDKGEIDAEGRLRLVGRIKDSFKTAKGRYVIPVPIEQRLASANRVEAACVLGRGQPQPFGLVMLSKDTIAQMGTGSLANTVALAAEFERLLDDVNEGLSPHEKLDYIVLATSPWNTENGLLTPTLKIRRNEIDKRFLPNADEWRSSGQRVIFA